MEDAFAEFPTLNAARQRSRKTLAAMAECLGRCADRNDVVTIAVAGSLGRLEQTPQSDVDLIVIVDDASRADPASANAVMDFVWERLAPLGMTRPKAEGVFSQPLTPGELCDASTLGIIDEDLSVFGVRMQLLLEGRAVFGAAALDSLTRGILDRFVEPRGDVAPDDVWRALLDDLLRYHRSLCARYRFVGRTEPDRAAELQLKAGYSRLVNVAGLLLLMGESLKAGSDAVDWLAIRLPWTPLERITNVTDRYNRRAVFAVFSRYEKFLAALEDDAFRRRLSAGSATERLDELLNGANELKRSLVAFLLERAQAGDWPSAFLEQLLL